MLSWAPITWKSFSLYPLSLCLMGNTTPALPALSLLAPWILLYCKSILVCWVPITWKETPLLYYLEHFSLTSLSIHLGMPYIVILVTRTLSLLPPAIFSIPLCSQLPPGAFLPVPRSCLFCLCPSHWFTGTFCCFTVPLRTYESTRLESSLGWSSLFVTLFPPYLISFLPQTQRFHQSFAVLLQMAWLHYSSMTKTWHTLFSNSCRL